MRKHLVEERGQMTVELAVALPVLIVVAVVAVNALTMFGECAMFDRIAHNAIRVVAASPAYGQSAGGGCALVQQQLEEAFNRDNLGVSVTCSSSGLGYVCYTTTLEYAPTLFGMGLRSEIFGVSLPTARHSISFVVDPHKAAVIV